MDIEILSPDFKKVESPSIGLPATSSKLFDHIGGAPDSPKLSTEEGWLPLLKTFAKSKKKENKIKWILLRVRKNLWDKTS